VRDRDEAFEILRELEALKRDGAWSIQRNAPRLDLRGEAELLAIDQKRPQDRPLAIQLRDISLGGFGFLCAEPIPIHSQWRALFMKHHLQVGQQTVRILHCREVREGVHLVGSQVCLENGLASLLGISPRDLSAPCLRATSAR
jgi:c-di-GMP-binding flagellar brake protein YcgR